MPTVPLPDPSIPVPRPMVDKLPADNVNDSRKHLKQYLHVNALGGRNQTTSHGGLQAGAQHGSVLGDSMGQAEGVMHVRVQTEVCEGGH
jgi:hypothetical protein